MSSPPVTVRERTPVKEVARVLLARRITGVPVVDDDGRLLGVVSQADLVREEQLGELESVSSRLFRLGKRRPGGAAHREARDLMTTPALTVEPQSSAVRAAWLMCEHDVNRLVVAEDGVPLGMLTRTDLVRAFARSDAEVRDEILAEALPALEVSAHDVSVAVSNGEVVLDGEVENEFQARSLPDTVRCVLGVVAVDSRLATRRRCGSLR